MALTQRPTGLGSGVYKDRFDVSIYEDGEAVGRMYECGGIGTPPGVRWFWSMMLIVDWRAGIKTNGRVATLEEAKVQFRECLDRARKAPPRGVQAIGE